MEQLAKLLPVGRRSPRLWIERLVTFSEPDEAHVIRTVPFHRGLNLVWAREPAAGSAKGTRAAGHGVGKTSLCLLLRFCLGEASKAVADLREELSDEFPKGGVIVVVHLNDQPFTLCRYFNPYKDGIACEGDVSVGIWTCPTEYSDRDFLKKLADEMMSRVLPRAIPETSQPIEWKHVLAWSCRDQGARFKSFFSWREGEGAGLQRSRQDPPIVMRAVLGLLDNGESHLMQQLAMHEMGLEQAKKNTERLRQEPELIRRRIESSLRSSGNIPDDLPIHASDLFSDSVEQRIKVASEEAAVRLAKWDEELAKADQAVADLRAELKYIQRDYDNAKAEYELSEAALHGDEAAFRAIGSNLLKLKQLAGHCEAGAIPFSDCKHVQAEIMKLESTSDMRETRDRTILKQAMQESAGRAGDALVRKGVLESKVERMLGEEKVLLAAQIRTRISRRTAEIEANKWPSLLDELDRWEKTSGSKKSQDEIDASRELERQVEAELNRVRMQLAILQQSKSDRERALAGITDALTQQLLPDGAVGSFDPRDELRPFRLSMRGGEAYRVLEVLLGDIACMLDAPRTESSLPGFFIHDCPREADMSTVLYENFLSLIDGLQRDGYSDGEIPFQYIVTTTTPPPAHLQGGVVCLTLDPSSEDGLLFCRRFMKVRD